MSVFVHAQGIKTVGVKKWQNSEHVVDQRVSEFDECPLSCSEDRHIRDHPFKTSANLANF